MSDNLTYIEYSRDEIDSLHDGILKNKIFCNRADFLLTRVKRLTKKFHNEKDMFEWVNENVATIYMLFKERTPDVFSPYFASVILK